MQVSNILLYRFSIFDALILASALQTGCTVLATEARQDGRRIEDRLVIRNPFVELR